jgi:hypothetical protein
MDMHSLVAYICLIGGSLLPGLVNGLPGTPRMHTLKPEMQSLSYPIIFRDRMEL